MRRSKRLYHTDLAASPHADHPRNIAQHTLPDGQTTFMRSGEISSNSTQVNEEGILNHQPYPPTSREKGYQRPSPPPDAKPFRPFERHEDQENRPIQAAPHAHASSISAPYRSAAQPLQPVHTYARSADYLLDAAEKQVRRPPPDPPAAESYMPTRTAPRPGESSQSATLPAAPTLTQAPQGKRSFLVSE